MKRKAEKKILIAVPDKSAFKEPLRSNFQELGFSVIEFDYLKSNLKEKIIFAFSLIYKPLWSLGNKCINERLKKELKKNLPDMLLVSKGKTILPDTINFAKKEGVVTINWFSDLFDDSDFFIKTLPQYDIIFTADKFDTKINKKSMNIHHLPYAGFILSNKPDYKKRPLDVAFIGVWSKSRETLLRNILDYKPKIWGDKKWASSSLKNYYQNSWLKPMDVLRVYSRSKIVVNHHEYKTKIKTTLNFRVYEATANGAMVLSDFRKDLPKLFKIRGNNKEIETYKNVSELKNKLNYYLQNEDKRIAIAQRAFKRTKSDHSFKKRVVEIVEHSNQFLETKNLRK